MSNYIGEAQIEIMIVDYFSQSQIAFAIKIKNAQRYSDTRCLRTEYNIKPPQSFCYIFNDVVCR